MLMYVRRRLFSKFSKFLLDETRGFKNFSFHRRLNQELKEPVVNYERAKKAGKRRYQRREEEENSNIDKKTVDKLQRKKRVERVRGKKLAGPLDLRGSLRIRARFINDEQNFPR